MRSTCGESCECACIKCRCGELDALQEGQSELVVKKRQKGEHTNKVEKVLEEEKEKDLRRHSLQIWERDVIRLHVQLFSGRVEEPNLYKKNMNNMFGHTTRHAPRAVQS